MAKYSQEFLKKTVKVWQGYFASPLSLEDAEAIADNFIDLIKLLAELERKNNEKI